MSPTKSWRVLPLSPSPDAPVLLVSMERETSAYKVHVSDMANMWSEALDRKAICIRAWSENTTIDPSDTPDNMARFLTSIESALDSSHPGHDQTSITLKAAAKADAGEDGLLLEVICNIPGLQPLVWPMHLSKCTPSAISTDLVLPLVQSHLLRQREVQSLVDLLSKKDAVLNRLIDKIEGMGSGLEHIFNALSGKKKVSRDVAAAKVNGLAPFNQRRWKAELEEEDVPSKVDDMVNAVFSGEGLLFESALSIEETPQLDDWWKDFRELSSKGRQFQSKAASYKGSTPPAMADTKAANNEDDDDDFQVQATPPHLATAQKATAPGTHDMKKEMVFDQELRSPGPEASSLSRVEAKSTSKKPISRLGTLGGKQKTLPTRSPSPPNALPTRTVSERKSDESETASEADDDEDDATASLPEDEDEPMQASLPPPQNPLAKKGGLGKIGGSKPKKPSHEDPDLSAPAPAPASAEAKKESATQLTSRKLGQIGNKKSTEMSMEPDLREDKSRGRCESRADVTTSSAQLRETSQERADRKRQELKRELERKAAAGPAKKKRKF